VLLGIGIAPALVAAVTLIISLGYEDGIAAIRHARQLQVFPGSGAAC